MRFTLRSLKPVAYESVIRERSQAIPGVSFTIRRMSLARRIELAEAIRDLSQELDFQRAGTTPQERVAAAALAATIDREYLRWGLVAVSGLRIDGAEPAADNLYFAGPENLLREIVTRIKAECGLSDDERKN